MARQGVSQQVIADSLGVSQTVVSRVLNDKSVRVSDKIREKILAKAQELKYHSRFESKTGPELIVFIIHSDQWSNLPPINRGMKKALEGSNTLLVIQELTEVVPQVLLENAKGCVSLSLDLPEASETARALKEKVPVTLLLHHDYHGRVDSVFPDPLPAYHAAIQQLWQEGHRRFGYFGIREMSPQLAKRATGVEEALIGLGYPRSEPGWIFLPYRKEASDPDTRRLIGEYLDLLEHAPSRPSVIFFEIDSYAATFKEVAIERGYRIPGDYTLICHTGSLDGDPDLLKILVPWEELGYTAIKALEFRLENPQMPLVMHHVPHKWCQK